MNTHKSTTTTLPRQSISSLSPNTATTDPINTTATSDSTTAETDNAFDHRHRPTTTFQRSLQTVLGLRSRTRTQRSDAATTDANVETTKAMAVSTTITPVVADVEDIHNDYNDNNDNNDDNNNKYAEAQKLLHHDYHSTDNNKSNNMSSYAPSRGHRRQKWLPSLSSHTLTARTMLTLVLLELLAVLSVALAAHSVLPYHPYLLPVAIVLPALFSWSLYQTLSTRPRIQYNRTLQSYTHANSMIPHSKFPRCKKCSPKESIKLPRTHHCRKCGTCTPRMSHHCGVLGVCIGAHNHKSFLLMLIYALVGTALLTATLTGPALSTVGALFFPESGSGPAGTTSRLVIGTTVRVTLQTVAWLYAVYMEFILTVGLSALLVFHIRLAALNWTVLELTVAKRMRPVLCCCVSSKGTGSGCSGRTTPASGVQHQQPQQSHKQDRAADGTSGGGGVAIRHKSPFDTGSVRENLAEIFATRSSHFVHLLMPVVDYDYAVRIAVARFEEELQRTDDQV